MVTIKLMKDISNDRAYVEATKGEELLFAYSVTTYYKAENLVRQMVWMLEGLGHETSVIKNY